MSDRVLFTLALLAIALLGGGCMVTMQIAQTEIDRGFADRLILFLGTIAAAFIFMLKAERATGEVARKVETVERKVEMHHRDVEAKLERNTILTEEAKDAIESVRKNGGHKP